MELTELERAWRALDARLAGLESQAADLRRLRAMDKVRGRVRLLGLGQAVQLAVGATVVAWAGPYWIGQWGDWPRVASGIALHLWGLALLVPAVVQLLLVLSLDYGQPVARVQKRLLVLRRTRLWGERWGLVAGMFAWCPALLLLADRFGWDLWATQPAVAWANVALATALSAGAAWASYRCRGGFERDAAGGSLRAAEAELAALESPRD